MSQYVLSKWKEAHVRPVSGSSSGLCRNQKKFLLPPTHAALDFLFTRSFVAELLFYNSIGLVVIQNPCTVASG